MVLVSNLTRRVNLARRWRPSAVNIAREQKRYSSPYMPWPFDQYAKPGCAKYWLSKTPASDASQDEYPEELLYLDEIEARVHKTQENYTPSKKWKAAYNEYAWSDHDSVTETYGSIGGPTSKELLAKYGRGNKIDPSHYINGTAYPSSRVSVQSPYIHPDLRKRMGPLRDVLALPPEEPSVFKLWNPWTMLGATSVVLLSKEWFLIAHDFWHAHMFWTAWAFICTVCVDWWTWYFVLRGQEDYDATYFPLNEQTEELFKVLDKLESRPAVAGIFAAMGPYIQELGNRVVEKQKLDRLAKAHITTAEKLAQKLKEEAGTKAQTQSTFKENAFQATMKAFQSPDEQKKYMAATLKMMATKAELKPGVAEIKTESEAFKTKYNSLFGQLEKEFYTTKRNDGTLPYVLATDEELAAQKLTPPKKQARYSSKVEKWASKYHPVTLSTNFA